MWRPMIATWRASAFTSLGNRWTLLLLLLERRQELVSHEDIATSVVGPDVFTDLDAGIRTAILKIRRALVRLERVAAIA